MTDMKEVWKEHIYNSLKKHAQDCGLELELSSASEVMIGNPPKPDMGDFAFAMFPYAKTLRKSPQQIAEAVAGLINADSAVSGAGKAETAGPYVNIRLNIASNAGDILEKIFSDNESYGKSDLYSGKKVMVEFSCPNTNKPLHLGHLRNDSIGACVSRIIEENGAEVCKVNLINDRGIHICKSMLAYKTFGNGTTPESENIKSDHFVGDYYVKFDQWSKTDDKALPQAQQMLKAWEDGDTEVNELWKTMNKWTIDGIQETYDKTGISFDRVYYESKTYSSGKDEVLKGLEDGIFYKEEDGSVWADLSEIKLDKKVLLRGDGTSLYMTQDIGTAKARHEDWPFDKLIYVVGSEQKYHFAVLFYILKKLGFKWAEDLVHLSYGMVNLPEGKMKSREGTVVDADDLVADLINLAGNEIKNKEREDEVEDLEETSKAIALGALNYYLLQTTPSKDMIFNPKESLSFNGNTGPYLQYMGARISSMFRKFEERKADFDGVNPDYSLLDGDDEKELLKNLSSYPEAVFQAGAELNPSAITSFLYELARNFSRFYHDNPVLNCEDKALALARLELSRAVLQVLKNAFKLVGIPFLQKM